MSRWEKRHGPNADGPSRDWWERFEPSVGVVTVAWRTQNGISGWYLTNATGAVHVLLDGQTKPERNPAPLDYADAVLAVLAGARADHHAGAPTAVDLPGDPAAQRRIVFVVPAGSPVPPVGMPVSVPVEADWLELGTIAAGRVVNGGIELTLELHENLLVAGGADTNESVA